LVTLTKDDLIARAGELSPDKLREVEDALRRGGLN